MTSFSSVRKTTNSKSKIYAKNAPQTLYSIKHWPTWYNVCYTCQCRCRALCLHPAYNGHTNSLYTKLIMAKLHHRKSRYWNFNSPRLSASVRGGQ